MSESINPERVFVPSRSRRIWLIIFTLVIAGGMVFLFALAPTQHAGMTGRLLGVLAVALLLSLFLIVMARGLTSRVTLTRDALIYASIIGRKKIRFRDVDSVEWRSFRGDATLLVQAGQKFVLFSSAGFSRKQLLDAQQEIIRRAAMGGKLVRASQPPNAFFSDGKFVVLMMLASFAVMALVFVLATNLARHHR